MFCPQCGNKQSDELKFCNLCGANLYAVRQVVSTRATDEKFDWNKTWVAEMMLSETERKKRQADFEQRHGLTPEINRYNEIKGGVITSFVGIGLVFLLGVIPLLVGLALIFNGLVVSRKIVELQKRARGVEPGALPRGAEQHSLKSADTNEVIPTGFSVTEGTTKHLTLKKEKQ